MNMIRLKIKLNGLTIVTTNIPGEQQQAVSDPILIVSIKRIIYVSARKEAG